MDKKKIGLIVIILFLLIGLGSFVFANPNEEENLKKGDDVERVDKVKDKDKEDKDAEDDGTLETVVSDNNTTTAKKNNANNNDGNGSNGGTGMTGSDENYDAAKDAVKKAESSFTQDDVDNAYKLVNDITDETLYNELTDRLEAVQDAIDAEKLVAELENKVNSSKALTDMSDARDYRTEEKIKEIVSKLKDSAKKDALQERLETVGKILDDNASPVITGVKDNGYVRKDVTLTITDENPYTIKVTLDGKDIEYADKFTKEGTYVVTVVDKAFNEKKVTFTIDKTAPKVTGAENGKYYRKDVTLEIIEENIKDAKFSKDGNKKMKPFKSGDKFTEEGVYFVRVTDKAYNTKAELTFTIDKTAPTAVVEYNPVTPTNRSVTATLTASEEVKMINSGTWNPKDGFAKVFKKVYWDNAEQTATFEDKAGNTGTIKVVINNIDKVAPKVVEMVQEYEPKEGGRIKVTINTSEEIFGSLINKNEWRKVSETEYYTYYYRTKDVTIKFTDKAGNEGSYAFRVDADAPVISGFEDGFYNNKNEIVYVRDENLKSVTVNGIEQKHDGKYFERKFATEGTYVVVATDITGNSTTKTVTIDKTAPAITGFEDGSYNNKNEIVYVRDKNLKTVTINGVEQKHDGNYFEDKFTHDGKYTVVAIDKAGNKTTKTVTIDKVAPVFTGLTNGIYYQDDITVTVNDENLDKITAKVYANNYEVVELENNAKLTKESVYYLTATDKAGNTTSIYVAVDKTNPKFIGLMNGHQYNKDLVINVEDLKVKTIEVFDYKDGSTKTVENGTVITEEGKYKITATDYSGRKTQIYVILDKTAPSITGFEDGSYNNKNEIVYVDDTNLRKVTINGKEQKVSGTHFERKFASDGTYVVEASDAAGNVSKKTVTIDKTAPEFTGLKSGVYYQDDITVDVRDTNLDKITAKVYADNYEVVELENNTKLTKESVYYLTATDKAGNTTSIYVAVDKTNPKFIGLMNGHQYNKDLVINVEDLKVKTIEVFDYKDGTTKTVENGTVITEEGKYKITATDYSGRKTQIYVILDKTAPEVKNVLILGGKHYDAASKQHYVSNGDNIYVNIQAKEELFVAPTIKLNDTVEIKAGKPKYNENNNVWIYSIAYKLVEGDGLADGEIQVKVFGYSDVAGNVGRELTNADMTLESQKHVIIDRTIPTATLTYSPEGFTNHQVVATLTASEEVKLVNAGTWNPKDGFAKEFKKMYPNNANQIVTFEDKAGNVGTINLVVNNIDTTKPVFENVKPTMESDVTIKVIEENLDRIEVYDKITKETYTVPNGHVLTKEGYYKILAYDKAGNVSDPWNLTIDNAAPVISIENARENGFYNHDVVVNISDIEINQVYLNDKRMGRVNKVTVTEEGTYTVWAKDNYGHESEKITFTIDKVAPNLVVDTIVDGVSHSENPQVHATDVNPFTITVKASNGATRIDQAKKNENGLYSVWFGIGYMTDESYIVEATDVAGNPKTITFKLDRSAKLADSRVGSNLITADGNSINNFNSFAIKFDKDVTFKYQSPTYGYKFVMEYSTDGGKTYKQSGTEINNYWDGVLHMDQYNKYPDTVTIPANSKILWSGTGINKKYPEILNAIKATKDTDNKVYVRTVFTVVQPHYTKTWKLDPVVYSKGGTEVSPRGLADF